MQDPGSRHGSPAAEAAPIPGIEQALLRPSVLARMLRAARRMLVVWSEGYYLHCPSLSHKQIPEVTLDCGKE